MRKSRSSGSNRRCFETVRCRGDLQTGNLNAAPQVIPQGCCSLVSDLPNVKTNVLLFVSAKSRSSKDLTPTTEAMQARARSLPANQIRPQLIRQLERQSH